MVVCDRGKISKLEDVMPHKVLQERKLYGLTQTVEAVLSFKVNFDVS